MPVDESDHRQPDLPQPPDSPPAGPPHEPPVEPPPKPTAAPRLVARPRGLYAQRAGLATLAVVAAGGIAIAAYVVAISRAAPSEADVQRLRVAQPSVLMSADGVALTSFRRTQQEHVALDRVSPHAVQALIATEDHRFYEHRGIDIGRSVAAVWHTLTGNTQGASTITQQLARNLFPDEIGRARTIERKLKEMITARRIERVYSKAQILEHYLNSAPFLYNAVGIEMAARTYFEKSAADLDVLESATLIGMLKGTKYYNPVQHPERAHKRRNVVLAQMVRHGMLPEAQLQALRGEPLQVRFNRQAEPLGPAPHFALVVRKWLLDWADEHDRDVYADGLVVHTTLDSRLQEAAAAALERQAHALQQVADVEWSQAALRVQSGSADAYAKAHPKVDAFAHFWSARRDLLHAFVRESAEFKNAVAGGASDAAALQTLLADRDWLRRLKHDKTRLAAGFVAVDPAGGEVKAWVGSRDFDTDQYDHVAQAARQPGSTFKPIVYGAALEAGVSPDVIYVDGPVEVPLADGTVWKPTDMSGFSERPMSLREGLALSKNTITAQLAQDLGTSRIVAHARALGIEDSTLDEVPSLALGTSPVTLLEMVSAFATIARQGQHHRPIYVRRITDKHGRVIADFSTPSRRAMAKENAADLIDMLRGVVTRGTGTAVKTRFGVTGDVAGKTGTTQHNTDGWFILMHPKLVAGAWVGFNDARVTMRSDHWGQGGHNAILVVGDFFRSVQKQKLVDAKAKFPPPHRPAPLLPVMPVPNDGWGMPPTDQPPGSGQPSQALSMRALDPNAPKSATELEQVMINMRRDPVTGAPRGPSALSQ
jgi:penicillin-binding protein 1A